MMDWNYQHLRLTAFLEKPLDIRDISWWKETVGDDPDNININFTGIPIKEEEGFLGELILKLKIEPTRVDWTLNSPNTQGIEDFPTLGDRVQAVKAFTDIANKWFKNSNLLEIKRLAFGSRLQKKVKNRIEGYKDLNKILQSVELDPENSSDFLYQINRPRLSSIIKDLWINRLAIWRVLNSKVLALNLGISPQGNIASDIFATNLDLDISSDANRESNLPKNDLQDLLSEFIELGNEIAQNGDTK